MSIQSNVALCEVARPVVAFAPGIPSTSTSTYIGLKNYERVTFLIQTVNDSTGSASAITLKQATDSAGTGAKTLAFTSVYKSDDVGTLDTLTLTAVASNTFSTVVTASKNGLYVVDIKAADLDVANSFEHVAVGIGTAAHTTVTVIAIARSPKYADQQVLTAL